MSHARFTQKFITKVLNVPADQYIGNIGDIWLDEEDLSIRLSNGSDPGGVSVSGGGGSTGPIGPTGPQGVTGPASTVTGPAGTIGNTGPMGNTGPTGPAAEGGGTGNVVITDTTFTTSNNENIFFDSSIVLPNTDVNLPGPIFRSPINWSNADVTYNSINIAVSDSTVQNGSTIISVTRNGHPVFYISNYLQGVAEIAGLRIFPTTNSGAVMLGTNNGSIGAWSASMQLKIYNSNYGPGIAVPSIGFAQPWYDFNNSAYPQSFIIYGGAPGSIQIGDIDEAVPVHQTIKIQSVLAGTLNTTGANFIIAGSKSTGDESGGSIIFQVSTPGISGSDQNDLVDALYIDGLETGKPVVKVTGALITYVGPIVDLPSSSSVGPGGRAFVTDSSVDLATGIGQIVAGSGSNMVPVYTDGTNWRIG